MTARQAKCEAGGCYISLQSDNKVLSCKLCGRLLSCKPGSVLLSCKPGGAAGAHCSTPVCLYLIRCICL